MATKAKTVKPKSTENILPAGPLYRIRIDEKAVKENLTRRRASIGEPRRLMPVVIVVDEADTVHRARSIRALGSLTFAEVDPASLERGIHALRDSIWLATTRDAIELIND